MLDYIAEGVSTLDLFRLVGPEQQTPKLLLAIALQNAFAWESQTHTLLSSSSLLTVPKAYLSLASTTSPPRRLLLAHLHAKFAKICLCC